jgi:hypothetical protein
VPVKSPPTLVFTNIQDKNFHQYTHSDEVAAISAAVVFLTNGNVGTGLTLRLKVGTPATVSGMAVVLIC